MYEYPPILSGTEQQQLHALRDYLVRMARSLETAEQAAAVSTQEIETQRSLAAAQEKKEAEEKLSALRRNAANLRALIVKTAGEAESFSEELGAVRQDMESRYLAKSEFGDYMEQIRSSFLTTARGVVESYDFAALIEAVGRRADALDLYLTAIRGEIRRGLITDPGTGETVMGRGCASPARCTRRTACSTTSWGRARPWACTRPPAGSSGSTVPSGAGSTPATASCT